MDNEQWFDPFADERLANERQAITESEEMTPGKMIFVLRECRDYVDRSRDFRKPATRRINLARKVERIQLLGLIDRAIKYFESEGITSNEFSVLRMQEQRHAIPEEKRNG